MGSVRSYFSFPAEISLELNHRFSLALFTDVINEGLALSGAERQGKEVLFSALECQGGCVWCQLHKLQKQAQEPPHTGLLLSNKVAPNLSPKVLLPGLKKAGPGGA